MTVFHISITGQAIGQGAVQRDGSESERIAGQVSERVTKTGDQKIEVGTEKNIPS